jgi:putative membrane-bound dehydrogenase-like protein
MVNLQTFLLVCLLWPAGATLLASDVPGDLQAELPRVPPVPLADAVGTLVVEPGFRMDLVAHEPLVADPVAMAFDEHGRLFVVEMRGYSEQGGDALGVVRLLTDHDGDGHFDDSTVYLDGLSWPTAICCYEGGVFLGTAPDILYCKDTNGDGRADLRKRVFTGFGKSNVQGLLNSFQWGLDNRIHGATSSAGGQVRRLDQPAAETLSLRGRDFSFDPATLRLRAESGGGQHGMCFDRWGRKFNCSNSDHLRAVVIADRYLARNPYFALPSASESIAADGPQAEVFRRSPVEPWRIVRTRLRVAGQVPGPVEGGGRAAGYFTSATGVTLYDGDAWPEEFRTGGYAFVGDVGSNIIHRKRLESHGVSFIGRRIDRQHEFVASTDIWFRPVQFCNAPDGTLYVADFHREVIEHPDSLPPAIKQHLDLRSGSDRGRIYRILPDGFEQPLRALPGDAEVSELVAMLGHPNGWHRLTAARLLYERQDPASLGPLEELVLHSPNPLARMHALAALSGQRGLSSKVLDAALADSHPRVREHAVALAGQRADDPTLRGTLLSLTSDTDQRVRFQLALTLGDLAGTDVAPALAALLRSDADSPWTRAAVMSACSKVLEPLIANLAAQGDWATTQTGRSVMAQLEEMQLRQARGRDPSRSPPRNRPIVEAASEPLRRPPQKADVIERYLAFDPVGASAERGAAIFKKTCAACHDVDRDEGGIAPSVAAFRNKGAEFIVVNLIDPNRELNPQYMSFQVTTVGGLAYAGILAAETATSVTLAAGRDALQTVLRIDIDSMESTGASLMPDNLDQEINPQQMADLLAYLLNSPQRRD